MVQTIGLVTKLVFNKLLIKNVLALVGEIHVQALSEELGNLIRHWKEEYQLQRKI